jgi:hypothetical protein
MKHRGKQRWVVLLSAEFVGTSTHCDNFDRDAVWRGWDRLSYSFRNVTSDAGN